LEAAGLREFEQVLVANLHNGLRQETYVQLGRRGSGDIILNGAAARLGEVGDLVIIMAFGYATPREAARHKPRLVLVDEKNRLVERK
jgi:aspartate 1-decarboxylase